VSRTDERNYKEIIKGDYMKSRKSGFTLVELLTVLVIVALMMGVLLPALNMVRNTAKEAKQKVQFATIEQAIMAFRGDYGDYPPSDTTGAAGFYYGGAQQLAEALMGWDLMGFHPNSAWRSNGCSDAAGINRIYPLPPMDLNIQWVRDNLDERKGPYLDRATANAFRLGNIPGNKDGLFDRADVLAAVLNPDTYVLCDSFGAKKLTFISGTVPNQKIEVVTAGTPILYYKANSSKKNWFGTGVYSERIYNYNDNSDMLPLINKVDLTKRLLVNNTPDSAYPAGDWGPFYRYLTDPKVNIPGDWPVNADSYVLISAGADGLYGTADDITNF